MEELESELGMYMVDFIKVIKEFYSETVRVVIIKEDSTELRVYKPERVTINMKDKCFILDDGLIMNHYYFKDYDKYWSVDIRLL